ncbi:MAG: periplasmic heavy metal sensor [Bacteroidia bacterium]
MSQPSASFWKWFAILLVILNIALLSFMLLRPDRGPTPEHRGHAPGPPPEGPARFIIEQLGFSKEQEAKFMKLKQAHRDSIDAIQEQGRRLRHEFFENLKRDTSNAAATEQFAKQIAANQQRIELVTYRHFEEVRKLCDPKQKQIFNDIIQEVLMRMAPHHKPPGREQGPPPPPGHP